MAAVVAFVSATSAKALVISPDLEALLIPGVGAGFQTISFENDFTSPVVVCTYNLPSAANGNAVVRLNAVNAASFQVRLQRVGPVNPPVVANDVYCLVAEETQPGDAPYTLPGGVTFEAHTVLSTSTAGPNQIPGDDFNGIGENVTADIEGVYANPAVIGQVMSSNDTGFSMFYTHDCESRARNPFQIGGPPGTGICVGKHSGQSNQFRANETVGFFVVETGTGTSNNVRYQSALGGDSVGGVANNPPFPYVLNDDYIFGVGSQSGEDGSDGGFAVLFGAAPFADQQVDFAIDEESISDNERSHTTEQVPFWVFTESDFGDAPASYNQGSPAEHLIRSGFSVSPADDIFIGASSTSELTESNNDTDVDDGGVVFPEIMIPSPGDTYSVDVPYTGNARLCGWIDFDINGQGGDGTFDLDERVCINTNSGDCTGGGASGICTLDFTIPGDFVFDGTQETWARFRIGAPGSTDLEAPTGVNTSGEVEDYRIEPNTLPVTLQLFESRLVGGDVRVSWQTATESFTTGFNIWAEVQGEWVRLNDDIIRTRRLDSVIPQSYTTRLAVDNLDGELTSLALTSVDFNGYEEGFGPFEPAVRYGSEVSFEPIAWQEIRASLDESAAQRVAASRSVEQRSIAATANPVLAMLTTDSTGITRVTHGDLLAAGIDLIGMAKSEIAMTHKGRTVQRRIGGAGRSFSDNSFIEFFAEAPRGSDALYLTNNHYQIVRNGDLASGVSTLKTDPQQPSLRYLARSSVEVDNQYANIMPGDDPFLMAFMFAGGGNEQTWPAIGLPGWEFDVAADADLDTPAAITMRLAGISDPPAQDIDGIAGIDPDHAIAVLVNGIEIDLDNPTAEGYTEWIVTGQIPPGVLQPGVNEMRIRLLSTGYVQTDLVAMDGFDVDYQRPLVTNVDVLPAPNQIDFVSSDETGDGFTVAGVTERKVAVWAVNRDPGGLPASVIRLKPRRSSGTAGDYDFTVPRVATPGARYWLSAINALATPSAIEPAPSEPNLLDQQGDVLVIVHDHFMPLPGQTEPGDHPLNAWMAARQLDGFTPQLIAKSDVVAQFGFGLDTPEAITNYLRTADDAFEYQHVLLVGGDVYDYKDILGTGAVSFIPTSYGVTSRRLQYTPSDALTADLDGDEIADKALGRWPVRTLEELETIVAKTLAWGDQPIAGYPANGIANQRTALLIAEEITPAEGYDFSAQLDRLNTRLASPDPLDPDNLIPWDQEDQPLGESFDLSNAVDRIDVEDIYADPSIPADQKLAVARTRIVDAVNQSLEQPVGQTLTVFAGHGAPMNWSFSNLVTPATAQNQFANTGSPTLMMPMACYTTYYNEPSTNTLAHQLLFAGGQGAVAVHAAATLSSYTDNEQLGANALSGQLRDQLTLGLAVEQARRASPSRDVRINWTVLGDPTLNMF